MKTLIISLALLLFTSSAFSQNEAIKIKKSGNGSPVLFLPGFTTPGSIWNETVANLKSSKQTHIVSYAGFNGIPSIDTPWYPVIKAQLIDYIKKEKFSDVTIIGHSMGGNLAVDLAAALPDQVSKLILVDAIPCMRELMMPGVTAAQIQYNSPYNKQLLQMKDDAFQQLAVMMATNMTMKQNYVDTLARWIKEADRNTYVYGYTDLLKLDLRDVLANVKAETLILGASFPSAEIARGTFEKQYANLKTKTIEMATDSKHFIMLDQPGWFYGKVNSFLGKRSVNQ
ncbi:MAG TPA: alpha/beta hydrolase [Segetibacter sp.]|jgi:pimeloyl-ACP methyl ester carboxylesterase